MWYLGNFPHFRTHSDILTFYFISFKRKQIITFGQRMSPWLSLLQDSDYQSTDSLIVILDHHFTSFNSQQEAALNLLLHNIYYIFRHVLLGTFLDKINPVIFLTFFLYQQYLFENLKLLHCRGQVFLLKFLRQFTV